MVKWWSLGMCVNLRGGRRKRRVKRMRVLLKTKKMGVGLV
jgi:hypothetical protein